MSSFVPGITQLATTKTGNAFLVEGEDGLTLVDTGTSKGLDALVKQLGNADLKRIVLTHAHPDHVQAAPELRERTGAQVLIHPADADWLPAGRVPAAGRSGLGARNFDRLGVAHWTPFHADAKIEDGDLVPGCGLRVIHTPGHSPGHVVLLHEPTRTLLVGDAIFRNARLGLGPAGFAADPAARSTALSRIPVDVEAVGFGHGDPLTEPDVFRAFIEKQRK